MKRLLILLSLAVMVIGCNQTDNLDAQHQAHEDDDHNHNRAITEWSENLELFMEFGLFLANQESELIIHLTKLDDFKPITSGTVELVFEPHGGQAQTFKLTDLLREGIYQTNLILKDANEYGFILKYTGEGIIDEFDLGHIEVFANEAAMEEHAFGENNHDHSNENSEHNDSDEKDIHIADEHGHGEGEITFLKEQQWKTDFQTAFGKNPKVKSSITSIAEVIPHQHGYAEVVSPVEGYLNVDHNVVMVVPGTQIKKGDMIAVVCPHVGRSNTWTERKLSFERSEKNFERATNLLKRNAISQREFEENRQEYLIEKAGFETLLNTYGAEIDSENPGCGHFQLKSPIDGIVAEVSVLPGQTVQAGAKLVTIVDPSVVWLRADIYEKDYYKLGKPDGATLFVSGLDEQLHLNSDELVLLNKSDLVDKQSRTIPVLFEIENKKRVLKIGQVIQAEIYTADEQESLCVPQGAILDEDVQKVLFVQHEGEAFEKRIVKTGPHFKGWVAITEGLSEGERVVTQGAYQIKLASVTTSVGQAHVH